MIDKNEVRKVVEEAISGTDLFVVDVTVSTDDRIVVTVDSPSGVDIDECVAISRAIATWRTMSWKWARPV